MRPLAIAIALAAGCGPAPAPERAPVVRIEIEHPGASPAVVERDVVQPIEAALAALDGVRELVAYAEADRATFVVAVRDAAAAERVRAALGWVALPEGAHPPQVYLRRPEAVSFKLDAAPREGTALGAPEPELVVEVDPMRLAALGVRLDEVVAALGASEEVPAGSLTAGGTRVAIRAEGRSDDPAALAARSVRSDVRVADLARVLHHAPSTPWARGPDDRVVLARVLGGKPGATILDAGSIPVVGGRVGIALVGALDARPEEIWRAVEPLLEAANGDGVALAVALHGESAWRARPCAEAEIVVMARDADAAARAMRRVEAAATRPGVRAAGFAAPDRWLRVIATADDEGALSAGADWLAGWIAVRPEVEASWRARTDRWSIEAVPRDSASVRPSDIARAVRAATTGLEVGELTRDGARTRVIVRLAAPEALERLLVPTTDGAMAPLGAVADLSERRVEVRTRIDGAPAVELFARVPDDGAALRAALATAAIPAGVAVRVAPVE